MGSMRSAVIFSLILHGALPVIAGLIPSRGNVPDLPKPVMVELAEEVPLAEPPRREESPLDAVPAAVPSQATRPEQAAEGKAGGARPSARLASRLDSLLQDVPEVPSPLGEGRTASVVPRRPNVTAPGEVRENELPLRKRVEDLEARVRSRGFVSAGDAKAVETAIVGGEDNEGLEPLPAWLQEMIGRKVRGYLPGLQKAYTVALSRNPRLEGKMLVRLRIDPSGRIRSADPVETSFRDPAFQANVIETIRRWTFDSTDGRTVEVLYPFVFVAPT